MQRHVNHVGLAVDGRRGRNRTEIVEKTFLFHYLNEMIGITARKGIARFHAPEFSDRRFAVEPQAKYFEMAERVKISGIHIEPCVHCLRGVVNLLIRGKGLIQIAFSSQRVMDAGNALGDFVAIHKLAARDIRHPQDAPGIVRQRSAHNRPAH